MRFWIFPIILPWALAGLAGCRLAQTEQEETSKDHESLRFDLEKLAPGEAHELLTRLHLSEVSLPKEPNSVVVTGSIEDLQKAQCVLGLLDSDIDYVIESLGPATKVRTLPSNQQISHVVGDLVLGTFAEPATPGDKLRGLLDVHRDEVVLIVPAHLAAQVRRVIAVGRAMVHSPVAFEPEPALDRQDSSPPAVVELSPATTHSDANQVDPGRTPDAPVDVASVIDTTNTSHQGMDVFDSNSIPQHDPNSLRGVLRPFAEANEPTTTPVVSTALDLPNADDVLDLTLPKQMQLIDLLDMVGEYLDLDYVYDAAKIRNQSISLGLHGKREGQLRVRDLYTLLETALKSNGLAMTRKEGNLVSLVPISEALDVDPTLVTTQDPRVAAGDMVVTRVFELKHVDVSSVSKLLENMKLSVALSPLPESQTLFVTCYAHRMARIEHLVQMLDQPGQTKEYRFRQLQFTQAQAVAAKVQSLAAELQDLSITVTSSTKGASKPAPSTRGKGQTVTNALGSSVYLDTDERTNRLLMIGAVAQLDLVEKLIDTLDIAQEDLRILRIYSIKHLPGQDAVQKLETLGVLGSSSRTSVRAGKSSPRGSAPSGKGASGASNADETQVVYIEATNCLLINATMEQHRRIQALLPYLDVTRRDRRSLKVYAIEHVEAEEVMQKLQELGLTSQGRTGSRSGKGISSSGKVTMSASPGAGSSEDFLQEPAQVVVLESTNSLLINASEDQHEQIVSVMDYVDTAIPREAIPYEIYFLENQSPDHLSEILSKIIQETVFDKEGKISAKLPRQADDQIVVVADELTFSLIVYANRKNQDWISVLIERLDRQQPQVLIDVTLVEVSKSDQFNYDLNLITSLPDLKETSGLMGPISPGVAAKDIIDKLQSSGRKRFVDLQANAGSGHGFYGDEHVMLLLNLMQEENYGRVLAKPKILVNNNETGTIETKDTTHVQKIGQAVLPGNTEAITTSVDFTPYDAGIRLEIVPHISEADMLRLEISMSRSDFIATDGDKPPDNASNDITTVVTVPDGSTIILGGMLKFNQSKGGTKVPGLGDLPLLGGLFRGSSRSDIQRRMYVFVKAEIIRPAEALGKSEWDLKRISDENRKAFEDIEKRFNEYRIWPGLKTGIIDPCHVLEEQ